MVALMQLIAALFIASMPVSCCALTLHFPTIEVRIAANGLRLCAGGEIEFLLPEPLPNL